MKPLLHLAIGMFFRAGLTTVAYVLSKSLGSSVVLGWALIVFVIETILIGRGLLK